MTSSRTLQAILVAAAIAAFIILLGLFAIWFRIFCLVVIGAAAVVTFPALRRDGGGWWWILGGGAAVSILAAIIAQPSTILGGWLALIGGLAVIIGALIGFPRGEADSA